MTDTADGHVAEDVPAVRTGQIAPRNRWDHLDVPGIGGWQPTRTLSVVTPYYQARDALETTLTALAAQTYPAHLTQIVVADDGSDPPLRLADDHLGLDVTVVRQDDLGFRLAGARNLGADAADGEILVFLDADMVAEPDHLEAHARWHHVCDHAVTLGFRQHVEFTGVTPADITEAAHDGSLASLFEGRERSHPVWLERHMERMGELTSDDDDLFRAVTGGNLGIRAELFDEVGGFDASFTQWGSEDTEIGQRLFNAGALLVPERRAACWHQGNSRGLEPHERESLAEQRAKVSQLIPHPQFRRLARGRGFTVPRVVVEVDAGDAPHATVTATLESVLASDLPDLEVLLRLPQAHPQRVRIEREWEGDPRVVLDDRRVHVRVPYRVTIPAGAALEPQTLDGVVWQLSNPDDPIGVLRTTLPDEPPSRRAVLAVWQRALGRARRGGPSRDDEALLTRAGELFGQRWLSGDSLGLTWAPVDELAGIVRRRVRPREPSRAAAGPSRAAAAPAGAPKRSAPADGAGTPSQAAATTGSSEPGNGDAATPSSAGGANRRAGVQSWPALIRWLRRGALTTLPAPVVGGVRRWKQRLSR